MRKIFALLFLLASLPAAAQTIQQSGSVTPGHVTRWCANGVVCDGGTAAASSLTSIGVTTSGPGVCQNSGPTTGPFNRICLEVTQTGGGVVSVTNVGGATGGFSFKLNGTTQGIVTINLPTTANGNVCFADTTGTLKNCTGGAFISGPGTTTQNALVRWNSSVGTVVADSTVLLDGSGNLSAVTSVNKVAITAPAASATLTIANTKTLTVSNTLTFTGTDGSSVAFGTGGTATYTSNNLSVFAATTSAQLAGVISDETGTGALVFANTPTLVTPVLGAATATTINGITITASTGTLTLNTNTLAVAGSATALTFAGVNGATITFQNTGTVVNRDSTDTLTNKTLTSPTINTAIIANTASLSVGQNGVANGTITLNGSSTGAATLKVAAAAGSGINFQIPITNGSNGQLLQTDGSGNTSWVTASGTGTVTTITAGTGITLSSGATCSTSCTVSVTAPATVPIGGTGNTTLTAHALVIGEGASATADTGAGTAGQCVASGGASADPSWKSGCPTLLNTLTASNSLTVSDTTSLTATYSMYVLEFVNLLPQTNNTQMRLRVNSAGVQTTGYQSGGWSVNSSSSSGQFTSTTMITVTDTVASNTGAGVSGRFYLVNPSQTSTPKTIYGQSAYVENAGAAYRTVTVGGAWIGNGAVTGIEVSMSSGNLVSGVVRIYGVP